MPKGVYQRKARGKAGEGGKGEEEESGDSRPQSRNRRPTAKSSKKDKVPKLLLKVPKDEEKEEDSDESDMEPLLSKVKGTPTTSTTQEESKEKTTEESEEEEEEGEEKQEEGSKSSKRPPRKKRRVRLTFYHLKEQKKKRRLERMLERGEVPEPKEEKEKVEVREDTPEPTMPLPEREVLGSFSPLHLLMDHLLREIEKKDPEQYFHFPVTDDVAPDYSTVITNPMDLYTIRVKLNDGKYETLAEFKADFDLIVTNATKYNELNTVYYLGAKKLGTVIYYYFSKAYLVSLINMLPFMKNIPSEQLADFIPQPETKPQKLRSYESVIDDMHAKEVREQAQNAARDAAAKLAAKRPNSHLAFWKQNSEGLTTLNVLTPERVQSGGEKKEACLGDLVGRLQEGNPGLPLFSEKPEDLVVPISSLDYGPYASFAPQFDSTWATLSKKDSQLLLSTYGDKTGAQYAWSLRTMARDSSNQIIKMVDSLLDNLTNGQHTKVLLDVAGEEVEEHNDVQILPNSMDVDFNSLKTLAHSGIDVSFLENLEKQYASTAPVKEMSTELSTQLQTTGFLLKDLEHVQSQRLSQQPDFTLTKTPGAMYQEIQLAGAVLENLQELAAQVRPEQLVAERDVRGSMGIACTSSDDIDMDVLREFLEVPDS